MKAISKSQFDALTLTTKNVNARYLFEEIAWFKDEEFDRLATIVFDLCDQNFSAMILCNNGNNQYCTDAWGVEFETAKLAEEWIKNKLDEIAIAEGGRDLEPAPPLLDIFKDIANPKVINPAYTTLKNNKAYSPAKELIKAIASKYPDRDGNFIKDFQSLGFDSRMWELYLYCYLKEEKFNISEDVSVPDFVCEKFGKTISIEAVTVGRHQDNQRSHLITPQKSGPIEMNPSEDAAVRFGGALYNKMKKRYWENESIKGQPFLIAIADFYDEMSMALTFNAIVRYLYGYDHKAMFDSNGNLSVIPVKIGKHKGLKKEIESGFFFLPNSEHVSGVLFSAVGTISKFNRIGLGAGLGSKDIQLIETGVLYRHDQNAITPQPFRRVINSGDGCESWAEGMNLFLNPNAVHEVDPDIFENTAVHVFNNGQIEGYIPIIHPYFSNTAIFDKSLSVGP